MNAVSRETFKNVAADPLAHALHVRPHALQVDAHPGEVGVEPGSLLGRETVVPKGYDMRSLDPPAAHALAYLFISAAAGRTSDMSSVQNLPHPSARALPDLFGHSANLGIIDAPAVGTDENAVFEMDVASVPVGAVAASGADQRAVRVRKHGPLLVGHLQ
jgi:hypothetical protein